jgi:hypothetical protein
LERELEYGRSGFALQFMLDTSLSDANKFPLKINDLIISSVGRDTAPNIIRWTNNPLSKLKDLPNLALAGQDYYSSEAITSVYSPYEASVLSIDPSGRGADETGYAVGKMLAGNVFIPDAGGITGGYSDEALIAICNKAKEHKVNLILIESNFGDGMYSQLLRPHLARIYPCTVEEVRHNQQKELRIIETLEPVMNQHRLIVDPKVILRDYESAKELYSPDKAPQFMLFYQLSRISKQRGSLKHDDRLDAFAMVVRHFTDKLGNDQENQEKRRKEELFDDYVDQFVKEMGGSTNGGANWQSRMYSKLGRR